jgi:hypothetical protein
MEPGRPNNGEARAFPLDQGPSGQTPEGEKAQRGGEDHGLHEEGPPFRSGSHGPVPDLGVWREYARRFLAPEQIDEPDIAAVLGIKPTVAAQARN